MTEAALQRAVLELAARLGWRCYHARPARTSTGWRTPIQGVGSQGWPDLTLLRRNRLVYAELKAERGRVSKAQQAWLDGLTGIRGAEVYVWKPQDWTSGAVEAVLRGTEKRVLET